MFWRKARQFLYDVISFFVLEYNKITKDQEAEDQIYMRLSNKGEICINEQTRMLDGIIYTYRLLLNDSLKYSSFGLPLYSIEVDMENVKSGKVTKARSGDLFSEERKATAFFNKLVRNLATPIDLAYIVEDEFA